MASETRIIKLIVPTKYFPLESIPETISFENHDFGKKEKGRRNLIRAIWSAIDNNNNIVKYEALRSEVSQLRSKRNKLNERLRSVSTISLNDNIETFQQKQKEYIDLKHDLEIVEKEFNEKREIYKKWHGELGWFWW